MCAAEKLHCYFVELCELFCMFPRLLYRNSNDNALRYIAERFKTHGMGVSMAISAKFRYQQIDPSPF